MEYTSEQISEAFEKSSRAIKKILSDDWITNDASYIGRDFNLRIDRVDIYIHLIGLTLLNLVNISNFIPTLEKELELSHQDAVALAQKTDDVVFQKVRDIILNDEKGEERGEIEKEETREKIEDIIEDIDGHENTDQELSFKDKFNKVVIKETERKLVDPYKEPID